MLRPKPLSPSVRVAHPANATATADVTATAGAPPRVVYACRCYGHGALAIRRSTLDVRDRVGGACGARAIATDRSRAAGVWFATILARRHVCVAMCITLGERA
jgi:hypothetical protein